MIEEFLSEDRKLRLAIVIVDSRNTPSELDQIMIGWLNSYRIPFRVVATKIDKISRSAWHKSVASIAQALGVQSVVPFSASKGIGVRKVWGCIQEHVCA
jgi:GTP-binding protein